MARKAVAVDDDNGIYQFQLGAEPVPYTYIRKGTAYLEVIERLHGWAPWYYAIKTDGGTWFVDGATIPQQFGTPDEAD